MRAFLAVLAVVAVVGVVAAANLGRGSAAIDLDWQLVQAPPREVAVAAPARGPIVQTVTAPGEVELVEEAEIASQIVGRVVEVHVKDGDVVHRGDLLVKIDETEARARLDSTLARMDRLRAAIAQADAELGKARRDVNRSARLTKEGAASTTELADAQSAFAVADASRRMCEGELAECEAMRRTSQQDLDRTEIRSPIDGVVAGVEVEVGEVVIAGTTNLPGTVLMTVGDPSRMRVRADVDETDVPLVRSSQPARVYLQADPTRAVPCSVDIVAPKGIKSGEVVSFQTLIDVPPDASGASSLLPGMTATVEIEVRRAEDALGVPVQAVVHRRRKDLPDTPAIRAWSARHSSSPGEKSIEPEARYVKTVFVLEGGVARARPVETGLSDEQHVEIREGIGPDDLVIVGPFRALDELKDGDPITRETAPPAEE